MRTKNETFVPKINEPLVRQTMRAIADDLDGWNQTAYVMDNEDGKRQCCFAGRALALQGYTVGRASSLTTHLSFFDHVGERVTNATEEAAAELGFTDRQAIDIFGWFPGITSEILPTKEEQFQAFAEHVLAVTGIGCR